MYDTKTHTAEDRIVSISRPYLRPIVRGKAKSPVEFGAKLDIRVADGYTRLETLSFDAYNEATFLKAVIERYHQRTGKYPKRVLADKNTETGEISSSVRNMASDCPVRRWVVRGKMLNPTRNRNMRTYVSG